MGMQLSGSLELTGSLTTSGAIVAQTLVVQTITSSITQMTGSNIFGSSLTNRQQFTGSVTVTGSLAVSTTGTELQVNASGVTLGNSLTDSHVVSGSFRVNPNGLFVSGSGFVGVGAVTSSIGSRLVVSGSIESLTDSGGEGGQLTLRGNTFQYGIDNFNGTGVRIIRENDGTGAAGAALMFISGSGNVGIGTGNPASKLDILTTTSSTTDSTGLRLLNNSGENVGNIDFDNTFGNLARITGTKMAGGALADDGLLAFSTAQNSVLGERMRITYEGRVCINTTTAISAGRLNIVDDCNSVTPIELKDTAQSVSGQFFVRFVNNGNVVCGSIAHQTSTTVQYNTSSDYRLKTDLKDYSGLDIVSKIKTYDFQWIEDKKRMYGVLAHELSDIIPYAVNGEKDGEQMQGVDYSKIVPVLVKAIQELEARVKELENK